MPYRDPEKRRAYQRARRRLNPGRGSVSPVSIRLPPEFRLQTARDAIGLLEQQIRAVADDLEAGTLEKARCIGFLVGVSLKAIEHGDLAGRLEELEALLLARSAA